MDDLIKKLTEKKIKITPQRIAVLKAMSLLSHPTVEEIYKEVIKTVPGVSLATVYNVLDVLLDKNIVEKVKNDTEKMRYDLLTTPHHHMYCKETKRVEDYYDPELDQMLTEYFTRKKIKGFKLHDVKLQIMGEFENKNI